MPHFLCKVELDEVDIDTSIGICRVLFIFPIGWWKARLCISGDFSTAIVKIHSYFIYSPGDSE